MPISLPIPILSSLILIFVIWLFYEKNKSNKEIKQISETFWEKEHQADMTRKSDLSSIDYLVVSLAELPFLDTTDFTLLEYQNLVKALSSEKIVNLSGLSNTDLKLKYGRANLSFLSSYDQNFTNLVSTLSRWGSYLYQHNYITEAKQVFEYGVKCNSDIKNNYIGLARIYQEEGFLLGIDDLIHHVNTLDSPRKQSILEALSEMKTSTFSTK